LQSKCEPTFKECYGDGYLQGSFTGPCGTLVSCTQKCNCTDQACISKCTPDQACVDCTKKLATCARECTVPACAYAGTGGGDAGDGTCADLQACCDKITNADFKKSCTDTHAGLSGNDQACSSVLNAYKSQCP
jgi:hypothetical protein